MKGFGSRAYMIKSWSHALLLVPRNAELFSGGAPATNGRVHVVDNLLSLSVADSKELCDVPGQRQVLGIIGLGNIKFESRAMGVWVHVIRRCQSPAQGVEQETVVS